MTRFLAAHLRVGACVRLAAVRELSDWPILVPHLLQQSQKVERRKQQQMRLKIIQTQTIKLYLLTINCGLHTCMIH